MVLEIKKNLSLRSRLAVALLASPALVAGCHTAPELPGETPIPANYVAQLDQNQPPVPKGADEQWWRTLESEPLNRLIDVALKENYDLRIAESRVREARAGYHFALGALFPGVDGDARYTRAKSSLNNILFRFNQNAADATGGNDGNANTGVILDYENYTAGFNVTWEIDVFGRLRKAAEAQYAETTGTDELRRGVLLAVLGDVTRHYTRLVEFQKRVAIARKNIELQNETVKLTQFRFDAGLASSLDVNQAQALLATTQATVPTLEQSVSQELNRLAVLTGQTPDGVRKLIALDSSQNGLPLIALPPAVPVGLPSDLLRRRPDVRSAEASVAAAAARVGVAVAEMYPRFSITSALGFGSLTGGNLFEKDSRTWNVIPGMNIPIFQGGRATAFLEQATERELQTVETYKQTVSTAVEEVENSITGYTHERQRVERLQEAFAANQRAYENAFALYQQGIVDFIRVLESQRAVSQAEDAWAQSRSQLVINYIGLNKALGGGWEKAELMQDEREKAQEGTETEVTLSKTVIPADTALPVNTILASAGIGLTKQ